MFASAFYSLLAGVPLFAQTNDLNAQHQELTCNVWLGDCIIVFLCASLWWANEKRNARRSDRTVLDKQGSLHEFYDDTLMSSGDSSNLENSR